MLLAILAMMNERHWRQTDRWQCPRQRREPSGLREQRLDGDASESGAAKMVAPEEQTAPPKAS